MKTKTNNYIRVGHYKGGAWRDEELFFVNDADPDEREARLREARTYAGSLNGTCQLTSFWPMRGVTQAIMPCSREEYEQRSADFAREVRKVIN